MILKTTTHIDIAVIGGGASGFFTAIEAAKPNLRIVIFEKSNKVLSKVKISGGGRCNVTHACFEQHELVKNYPRGEKELLSPFHQFMPFDTIAWFAEKGVTLKTEPDGRMFPDTDTSQTIVDCFMQEVAKKKIKLELNKDLIDFSYNEETKNFNLHFSDATKLTCSKLVMATGSSEKIWHLLRKKDIAIVSPVPSLFTFNYKNERVNNLMGLTIPNAIVKINDSVYESSGPLLFTHWGFSGPAILKLSAWAARYLHEKNYCFRISIDFTHGELPDTVRQHLETLRHEHASKLCRNIHPVFIPARLWDVLCTDANVYEKRYADLSKQNLAALVNLMCAYTVDITGKSIFKEEFVTCGGVDLKDVHMKTLESKKIKGLFFTGECLNVDAITGGFNFQAAWTTAHIAAKTIAAL